MLTGIRNAFSTGFMRLVLIAMMLLLVVSFAIWGIGDIFRGQTSTTVATVGDVKLSATTLQSNFNRELQRLGRMTGRQITPDQARAYGLDRRMLGEMMSEATLDQTIAKLNLGVSDEALKERIFADPSFKGASGQFDANRFANAIREEGYNDATFLEQFRKTTLRAQLVGTLGGGVKPPQTMLDIVKAYQGESRVAEYITLTRAQAGDVAEPDVAALATYFERKKLAFKAPEYRKIVVVSATVQDLSGFVQVADDKVNAEFDRVKNGMERRQLQQMSFATKQEAEEALNKLKGGSTFEALAEERKLKPADIDLGTKARGELIDAKVRDAAFALKEGEVSSVIDGTFGPVLVRVVKIMGIDEARAKAEISARLAREGAMDEANRLHNAIEKERASGLSLADIAAKVGAVATVIDEVDAQGKNAADEPQLILGGQDLLNAAFRSEVGVENDPLQPRAGGFTFYEVASITPSRERKLEEVKDKVIAAFKDDEVRARLAQKAATMVASINAGKALSDLAKEAGVDVAISKPMTRSAQEGDWSASAVQMLFITPKGKAASSAALDAIDQIVFVTKNVIDPDTSKPLEPRLLAELGRGYENELINAYVARLQTGYGTSINQTLFMRATGGASDAAQ